MTLADTREPGAEGSRADVRVAGSMVGAGVSGSPGEARASGNLRARVVDPVFGPGGPMHVTVRRFGDHRGFFMETYSRRDFEAVGIPGEFVQDNHSMSAPPGTLRGMHFQVPPRAQAKLVRVLRGEILDVVVDLRRASPGYGRHAAVRLVGPERAGDTGEALYVPEGFAHGFVTLTPETEVAYKVTEPYAPEMERGVAWDDPDLALPWPDFAAMGLPDGPVLSEKDRRNPRLRDLPPLFP